jgi:seryl-tRNA synthetase
LVAGYPKKMGSGGEAGKQLSERDERIEELEGELGMVQSTLQDSLAKNRRLQEEMARKTVGGAEAAELRRKYNELVARYKQREEERKKLTEDYQRALDQLARIKSGAGAARPVSSKA